MTSFAVIYNEDKLTRKLLIKMFTAINHGNIYINVQMGKQNGSPPYLVGSSAIDPVQSGRRVLSLEMGCSLTTVAVSLIDASFYMYTVLL
jgi:hypothetical protein